MLAFIRVFVAVRKYMEVCFCVSVKKPTHIVRLKHKHKMSRSRVKKKDN